MSIRTITFAALLLVGGCGEGDAEQKVRQIVGDPDARFQALRHLGGFVCGEVNSRRRASVYVRFLFDERAGTVFVDPGGDATTSSFAPDHGACKTPFAYQTVEQRLSCAAAPQQEAQALAKRKFEGAWRKTCG